MSEKTINHPIIGGVIEGFRRVGLYYNTPTFPADQIAAWEKEFGVQFPTSYRETIDYGSYDKNTFHFIEPFRDKKNPAFIIFASWNNDQFAFDTNDRNSEGEYPVYILLDGLEPEKRYRDFPEWFQMVFNMTDRPINPE